MSNSSLLSVQIGLVAPLGPRGVPSGFVKLPVTETVKITRLGLVGDEQADPSVHGGPEKAVYAYPAAHAEAWAMDCPEHAQKFAFGAFGENLTVEGLREADLCIGDIHAIGTSRLQVCQPRQPCFKFALRFADDRLPAAMIRNGRSGWYYRVIEEGDVRAGDTIERIERPHPAFAFDRLVQIVYRRDATRVELAQLAEMDAVASGIRARARQSLGLA